MTQRRYLQLDVFAHSPGAGNPLGVIADSQGLDTGDMQALAAWLNLPETIFFLPPQAGADYHVRIFTPGCELPFAGHPSVGAAWAALSLGLASAQDDRLVQQCAAGLLPVRIARDGDGRISPHVRAPRAKPLATTPSQHALLGQAISRWPQAIRAPALWNNGPSWWLVELADTASVRTLQPDFAAIATLSRASQATGLAVFARHEGSEHDLAVRAFCPADAPSTPEDPVTGSANACIAALLHAVDALPGSNGRYLASQGRELGRDGVVQVRVDDQGEVWIGGLVQPVIQGQVSW
ncbi:PhzF family phenazine biosynthesis protein [Pseudoxanthomonas sp.]|uniref:PhzF family phenazine biosynthesis protein n=1 Tax=Pseudoxanthomonas sp. TaxID=1871049 RepID=UPI00262D0E74|nr:PhzF family phenazine biosynthesis protein [Pseudoxanthomonas sp.]WDS37384.1 MAG: PhzF family phenazine biosynthesis protein [Pseudoxanthomonas sp.]